MNHRLLNEITRMKENLKIRHINLSMKGAKEEDIIRLEEQIGIKLTNDMRDFFKIMNGSNDEEVGIVISDQALPIRFLSLDEIIEYHYDYSETFREAFGMDEEEELDVEWDLRIKPYLIHNLWLPIAEFGGCTTVYFDADPSENGSYGQIIVYQHDPDFIYYVGENLIAFLNHSNDLLCYENLIRESFVHLIQQIFQGKYSQLIKNNSIVNYSEGTLSQIINDLKNNSKDIINEDFLRKEIGISSENNEVSNAYLFISSNEYLYEFNAEVVMEKDIVKSICLNHISRKKTVTKFNKYGTPVIKTIDVPFNKI